MHIGTSIRHIHLRMCNLLWSILGLQRSVHSLPRTLCVHLCSLCISLSFRTLSSSRPLPLFSDIIYLLRLVVTLGCSTWKSMGTWSCTNFGKHNSRTPTRILTRSVLYWTVFLNTDVARLFNFEAPWGPDMNSLFYESREDMSSSPQLTCAPTTNLVKPKEWK